MSTHPLRIARCLRNLTIENLAEEAKVGASTIWRAEHNYPINAESRRRLCTYFSMTAQELSLIQKQQEKLPTEPVHLSETPLSEPTPALHERNLFVTTPAPTQDMVLQNEREEQRFSEEQMGTWLALSANGLASLFDAGWTFEAVLDALRVALRGVQGLPASMRQMGNVLPLSGEHISQEERTYLCDTLSKSVAEGWQLFHTSRPAQVLIVAQAQLYLVKQTHALLFPSARYSLYAALYNLIGAAFLLQDYYNAAQQSFEKAHIAALEGADVWNIAQSLNWQAITANGRGRYAEAIESIETALRLLAHVDEEKYVRLRAHLLADWAYNASLQQEHTRVEEKLAASAGFIEPLSPNEEFDLARWHQIAGNCTLIHGDYTIAINHLEQSLVQLPEQWLARRILTLIPLAETYARKHERDASIDTAKHITSLIDAADSPMLTHRFIEYQQILQHTFPHDQQVRKFIASVQHQSIYRNL